MKFLHWVTNLRYSTYAMLAVLALLILTTGCASIEKVTGAAPYGEVGVAYQIDDMSDWHVQTDREWQCDSNYQAHFEVGLDWGNTKLGYHHQSWWACGKPFNNDAELWQDDIRLTHTFGGK